METKASIIDYPMETLCPDLWDLDKDPPLLRDDLRDMILGAAKAKLKEMNIKPKHIVLWGGAASYQWRPGCDVDISIIPASKQKEDHLRDIKFDYRGHPVTFFLRSGTTNIDLSNGVYDIAANSWVKRPMEFPRDFDPVYYMEPMLKVAKEKASYYDIVFGALRRNIDQIREYRAILPNAANKLAVEERIARSKEKIVQLVNYLKKEYDRLQADRNKLHSKLAKDTKNGVPLSVYDRFAPEEVIYKYLDQRGYKDKLQDIYYEVKI